MFVLHSRAHMRQPVIAILVLGLSACGGGSPSSPSTPTPPTTSPPATSSWTMSGSVVDVVTGAPISGASLAFSTINQTQTSGSDGGWSLSGSGSAATRQAVTVTAAGYLTHETGVRWDSAGRRDVQFQLIP